MMVRPEPEQVVERVAAMVGSIWPASGAERLAWFISMGLPADREPVSEQPGRARTGRRPDDMCRTDRLHRSGQFHQHRGRFVGVHWFRWAGEDETETRSAAEHLRSRFSARWPAIDEASVRPAGSPRRGSRRTVRSTCITTRRGTTRGSAPTPGVVQLMWTTVPGRPPRTEAAGGGVQATEGPGRRN